MKRWSTGLFTFVALALLLSSCSGGTDSGTSVAQGGSSNIGGSGNVGGTSAGGASATAEGTNVEAGSTLAGFRNAFLAASCAHLFGCNYGGNQIAKRVGLRTQAVCASMFDLVYEPTLAVLIEAARAGVTTFGLWRQRSLFTGSR